MSDYEVVLTTRRGAGVSRASATTMRGAQLAAETLASDAVEAGYAYRHLDATLLLDGTAVVSNVTPHEVRSRAEATIDRLRKAAAS
jgi:hypothetical protein